MLDATAISSGDAPAAVGPYSQAIRVDGFVFCSGQIGLDPKTGQLVDGGIEAQPRRVLDNIEAVLKAADLTLADIVKATIFLVDMADFKTVNGIYGDRMAQPYPARSTFAVAALPMGARIEIEVIASAGA
jgi:2-iminobutanoate/2-iminopropanoate deaminase